MGMRLIFAGTPEFAATVLGALLAEIERLENEDSETRAALGAPRKIPLEAETVDALQSLGYMGGEGD